VRRPRNVAHGFVGCWNADAGTAWQTVTTVINRKGRIPAHSTRIETLSLSICFPPKFLTLIAGWTVNRLLGGHRDRAITG
jgi:hypothetical protein